MTCVCKLILISDISSSDSERAIWYSLVPKFFVVADFRFRAEKGQGQERLRRKTNANVFYFFICCVTFEPEMRVKESSASFKNNNF